MLVALTSRHGYDFPFHAFRAHDSAAGTVSMSMILDWLLDLRYLAMFGILFLCGVGLPIPEEVTLVGSGLLVGWGEAEFIWASVACVLGILAGDSIIFG